MHAMAASAATAAGAETGQRQQTQRCSGGLGNRHSSVHLDAAATKVGNRAGHHVLRSISILELESSTLQTCYRASAVTAEQGTVLPSILFTSSTITTISAPLRS